MKRVEIQIPEFLKGSLIKDLQDDEIICTHCGGTGLKIEDNVYGLGENDKEMFPYKHQSISFCPYCYNGVQNVCHYCGKVLGRNTRCDCKGYKDAEQKEEDAKIAKLYEKAVKITIEEAEKRGMMLYDELTDKYYSISDIYDYDDEVEEAPLPEWMFGTTLNSIAIDAYDIVESACDDLHDEAMDNITDLDELQEFLDKWCKGQTGTDTFYPDYKTVVMIKK